MYGSPVNADLARPTRLRGESIGFAVAAGVTFGLAISAVAFAQPGPPPTAGSVAVPAPPWFYVRSDDLQSQMRLGAEMLLRAQLDVIGDAPSAATPVTTLRPVVAGYVYKKWIRFATSMELAANPPYLLSAYVELQPTESFGLRLGQQGTPYSRHEFAYGASQLLMPEWDQVANYFWTGYDKGATAFGATRDSLVEWQLGSYLGSPLRQFTTIPGNYLFTSRLVVNPMGKVGATEYAYAEAAAPAPLRYSMGLSGFTSKATLAVENFNPTTFLFDTVPTGSASRDQGLGVDLLFQSPRVVALAEGYLRHVEPEGSGAEYTSVGAFAQADVLVYRRAIDAAVRLSWADVNLAVAHDAAYAFEVTNTWYVRPRQLAVKLRYGYGRQIEPLNGASTAGLAPLIFPQPEIHLLTAQLTLAI